MPRINPKWMAEIDSQILQDKVIDQTLTFNAAAKWLKRQCKGKTLFRLPGVGQPASHEAVEGEVRSEV